MLRRCFSFGCSFTHWFYWPTWADFIGINYEEYYNLAMPGSSNRIIHNRLIEADEFYNFNDQDLVLIGITNFGRFNWLEDKNNEISWCCHGGPQNWPENEKTKFLREKFWKQNYGIYDSWLMIKSAIQLKNFKKFDLRLVMSLDNTHFLNKNILALSDKEISMAKEIYANTVNQISLQEFSKDKNHHPDPIEHFNYAKQNLSDLITDRSTFYLEEILKNIEFTCTGEQSSIYGKLRSRYFNEKSPKHFDMYGKYH